MMHTPWFYAFVLAALAAGCGNTGVDSYAPIDCQQLELQLGDPSQLTWCNWS